MLRRICKVLSQGDLKVIIQRTLVYSLDVWQPLKTSRPAHHISRLDGFHYSLFAEVLCPTCGQPSYGSWRCSCPNASTWWWADSGGAVRLFQIIRLANKITKFLHVETGRSENRIKEGRSRGLRREDSTWVEDEKRECKLTNMLGSLRRHRRGSFRESPKGRNTAL